MSALTAVLTLAAIPLPGGGYYNFGDAVVFVSAATLGPVSGAFVGGLGGALGDLVLGYTFYAPFTLVIKAAEALVAGLVFRALKRLFRTDLLISRVLLPRDKRGKDEDGEKSDGEKGGDGDESAIN